MEDQTLIDTSFEDMRITDRMKSMLAEIAKWAKLLSIIGFIGIGFLVLAGISVGAMFAFMGDALGEGAGIGGGFLTLLYLLMALLYFFPVLYLYQFAAGTQKALASGRETHIEMAFEALRKHYRFLGILMIIILSLYALLIVIAIVGGGMGLGASLFQ